MKTMCLRTTAQTLAIRTWVCALAIVSILASIRLEKESADGFVGLLHRLGLSLGRQAGELALDMNLKFLGSSSC